MSPYEVVFQKYLRVGMLSMLMQMCILIFMLSLFGSIEDPSFQETLRRCAVGSWIFGILPIVIGLVELTICRLGLVKRP